MRIHNPDGSEAGACGNATRCVASLSPAKPGAPRSRHPHHLRQPARRRSSPTAGSQSIMGPRPARLGRGAAGRTARHAASAARRRRRSPIRPPAPWAIRTPPSSWPTSEALAVERLGPRFESTPLFPERANIGFAQILGPDRIRLRVWERGAGLTLACGSGACADPGQRRAARPHRPAGGAAARWRRR